MRHKKSFNHLGRTAGHRKAMMANMASSLILHKRIKTTTAKAKALKVYVEPLITRSKDDSTHARRLVFGQLQNKEAVTELFREISPKIMDRPGGYTRILKTGTRLGDNADMCILELVDYNENLLAAKEEVAAKSGRRRRRGTTKKKGLTGHEPTAETTGTDAVTETLPEEGSDSGKVEDTIDTETSAVDDTPAEDVTDDTESEVSAETPEDTEPKEEQENTEEKKEE
jgi:large subunit ribosomal protein L17